MLVHPVLNVLRHCETVFLEFCGIQETQESLLGIGFPVGVGLCSSISNESLGVVGDKISALKCSLSTSILPC